MRRTINACESWLKALLRSNALRVLYGTTLAELVQGASGCTARKDTEISPQIIRLMSTKSPAKLLSPALERSPPVDIHRGIDT